MSIGKVPVYNVRSPVYQAVSCIPGVGHLTGTFARIVLYAVKQEAVKKNDNNTKIHIIKMSKEYNKIGVARNVLTTALAAGAIALGILSGPTGAILATAHLLFALINLYSIRKDIQELNTVPLTAPV